MENLTTPSRKLALQILQEVNFENRLIGSLFHARTGVRTVPLYTLEEVFILLKEPYPQIDLDQLENWIRTAIKDVELADRIKTVIAQKSSGQDTLPVIRDLVGLRLIQCRQLAEGQGQPLDQNHQEAI